MGNLLVLGGAGYLGHQVVKSWLAASGSAQATIVDSMISPHASARMQSMQNEPRLRFVRGDARDSRLIQDCLSGGDFQAVLHVATGLDTGPFDGAQAGGDFAAATQAVMQAMGECTGTRPTFGVIVSTAPWGNDVSKRIGHSVAMRPATVLGVAEAVACEVALGLGRAAGIDTRVYAAPLAYGPRQLEGPLVDLIGAMLLGYPVATELPVQARWDGIYGPDLAERVCADLQATAIGGDMRRLVGNPGRGWMALVNECSVLLERFFAANPALKHRFPNATWRFHDGGIQIAHPGWPEQLDRGIGALTEPATPWTQALAETLRWYLGHQSVWQPTLEQRLAKSHAMRD